MNDTMIRCQGSKSIINRILLISTFLDTPLLIENFSDCLDVQTFVEALKNIGFEFFVEKNNIKIIPNKISGNHIYIQDAATAFRFLFTRLTSIEGKSFTIDVSSQLKSRPHKPLFDILEDLGACFTRDFPLSIKGRKLVSKKISIPANISSQFISSILLSAPEFASGLEVHLVGDIVSKDYIRMTIELMQEFGVEVDWQGDLIQVKAGQSYVNPGKILIEPDYSTTCYFWALGALQIKKVTTFGNKKQSSQADFRFLELLRKFGADIEIIDDLITCKKDKLLGGTYNMKNMPDQVPTLAVMALFAEHPTIIDSIEHLRHKETDRIQACVEQLSKLTNIKYENEKMIIEPMKKYPKQDIILKCYDDHRMVMAFSILQKLIKNINLDNLKAVEKSAPHFFEKLPKIDLEEI